MNLKEQMAGDLNKTIPRKTSKLKTIHKKKIIKAEKILREVIINEKSIKAIRHEIYGWLEQTFNIKMEKGCNEKAEISQLLKKMCMEHNRSLQIDNFNASQKLEALKKELKILRK